MRKSCCYEVPLILLKGYSVDESAQSIGSDSFLLTEIPDKQTFVVGISQREKIIGFWRKFKNLNAQLVSV
jgi:hypothetical protein